MALPIKPLLPSGDESGRVLASSDSQHSRKLNATSAEFISTLGLASAIIGPAELELGVCSVILKSLKCVAIGTLINLLTWMVANA